MTLDQVRTKYINYFKTLNHTEIPSASLVPDNDPTTLFTGSGMQSLIPYLLGADHPSGSRLVNAQRCFRAEDINEVGDNRHTTFFEMLGNWSLGDYFKAEQLPWLFNFLTAQLGLDPNRLYVTVFAGDDKAGITKDTDAIKIWAELFHQHGVDNKTISFPSVQTASAQGMQSGRIFVYDASKNWWSRAGSPQQMPVGELGGPDSEIFYDFSQSHQLAYGKHCHPNCDCGRFMEIGNSVFMEYVKNKTGHFDPLPKKNVDFGGGLERLTAASINQPDIFMVDALRAIITTIEKATQQEYAQTNKQSSFRIVTDHLRGAVFMIGDGVMPTNTDRGYFVRRLLRRAIRHLDLLGASTSTAATIVPIIIQQYHHHYVHLTNQTANISQVIAQEEQSFRSTLSAGLKKFAVKIKHELSGQDAWYLFMTYGFPVEMTKDLAIQHNIPISSNFNTAFNQAKAKHQAASKKGVRKKFKGGLADQSNMSIKYHTATHLLHAALRQVLGEHATQKGSNITPARLRFDFQHDTKLTPTEIKAIEQEVNRNIARSLDVTKQKMSLAQAKQSGAIGLFGEKYGDHVNVYGIGNVSLELCGGPHVKNTAELGQFIIIKEESAGAGIRRIKAILRPSASH